MTTTVTATRTNSGSQELRVAPSPMASAAAKTDAAAQKTFMIMTIGNSRYMVYVESKTAENKTFRHKATEGAFLALGQNFLSPILDQAPPLKHVQFQVGTETIQFSTPESPEWKPLPDEQGRFRSAYQAFERSATIEEITAAPKPPVPTPTKPVEPKPSEPTVQPVPFTPLSYAATNLKNTKEQLTSQTVATALRHLEQPSIKVSVGANETCHELSSLATLNLTPTATPTFIPLRLGASAEAGHFVALTVVQDENDTKIHYYDPKGRPMEASGALRTAYDAFAKQFSNVKLTHYETSKPDQGPEDNTHCGAHVLRHYERLLKQKVKTNINDYRTDLSKRMDKFLKDLENKKEESKPIFTDIPELDYPKNPHVVPKHNTVVFTSAAPVDYLLEEKEFDTRPVIICTPTTETEKELKRRSTLSGNNKHARKYIATDITRNGQALSYSSISKANQEGIAVAFTAEKLSEKTVYSTLKYLSGLPVKKGLVIPLPSTGTQEALDLYDRVLRLQEFEESFPSVTFTFETDSLRAAYQRAWEAKYPPAPIPEPAPLEPSPSPEPERPATQEADDQASDSSNEETTPPAGSPAPSPRPVGWMKWLLGKK